MITSQEGDPRGSNDLTLFFGRGRGPGPGPGPGAGRERAPVTRR